MAEITLTINGRNYGIACEDGQEQRVIDLGHHVDARVKDIARAGAASNETHLLVLTALMLADEVFDLRNHISSGGGELPAQPAADELVIAQAIDQLAERIDSISDRMSKSA